MPHSQITRDPLCLGIGESERLQSCWDFKWIRSRKKTCNADHFSLRTVDRSGNAQMIERGEMQVSNSRQCRNQRFECAAVSPHPESAARQANLLHRLLDL